MNLYNNRVIFIFDLTLSESHVRKNFIDNDLVIVKRAPGKIPDYILHYKANYPLAVVEAKNQTMN